MSNDFSLGQSAPDFELQDTEGTTHRLMDTDGATATAVVFTCNHCPYALAWHDRIVAVVDEYRPKRVRFLLINSNDAERYPADSYEAMKQRVVDEAWSAPYLHDETQEVARSWGAKTTPDVFVLDGELQLRYRGAPDADYESPAENASWLREALDQVLAGEQVARPETEPVGCSVKWKPE